MSSLLAQHRTKSGQVIEARVGDLTQERADAIVNAANSGLQHGGGVAGAIATAGGPVIQEASERWIREHGGVPTGQVAITEAGDLPCRFVIHTVGPVWEDGNDQEDLLLRQAVSNSLMAAEGLGLTTIALPAISAGDFWLPKRPMCGHPGQSGCRLLRGE